MTVQMFKKKPVVIEAMQLDGQTVKIGAWLSDHGCKFKAHTHPTDSKQDHIELPTLEGRMIASPGDWIIKGVQGEFYPCKPDIFEQTYTPVDEEDEAEDDVVAEGYWCMGCRFLEDDDMENGTCHACGCMSSSHITVKVTHV